MIKIPVDTKNIPEVNVWVTSDTHYFYKNICRGVTEWRTEDNQIPISQTRDFETIEKHLAKNLKKGDILITIGAGDVYKIGENLLQN